MRRSVTNRFLLLAALSWPAVALAAQPSTTPAPVPSHPETITVTGQRAREPAPVPGTATAPGFLPQNSLAAGPNPTVKPKPYCQTAYQNDLSGQPGTSRTQLLTGRCD